MAAFLGNLRSVVIAGFVLAILLAVLYGAMGGMFDTTFWTVYGPLAAHHLGRDVDRAALVFQFRLHPHHAENSRGTASRSGPLHHAGGVVLVPLGAMGTIFFGIVPGQHEPLYRAGLYSGLRPEGFTNVQLSR